MKLPLIIPQFRGRILLFSPRAEAVLLGMPLVFLALLVLDLHYAIFLPARLPLGRMDLIMSFVFMDTLHVGLTYALLLGLPEFQQWCSAKGHGDFRRFHLRIGIMFVCLFALIFASGARTTLAGPPWRHWLSLIVMPIMMITPHFHTMWQNRGLSLAYSRKGIDGKIFDETQLKRVNFFDRIERYAFIPLYASWAVYLLCRTGIPVTQQRALWSTIESTRTIQGFAFGGCAISVLVILAAALANPVSRRTFKFFYLLRLLMWPFTLTSWIAIFGISSCHGIEYLLVFLKMKRTSAISAEKQKQIAVLGFFFCAALLAVWIPSAVFYWGTKVRFLPSIGFAAAYLHYYLDRTIFQMRNPLNRATAGHLLLD